MTRLAACVIALAAFAPLLHAQRVMTPHDVAKLRTVSGAAVSPDGRHVAYRLSIPRDPLVEDGPPRSELWIHDVAADVGRMYVTGTAIGTIGWTGDSSAVLFSSKRGDDKSTKVWSIDVAGGEARPLFEPKGSVREWAVSADGKRAAYTFREAPRPSTDALASKGFKQIVFEEDYLGVELHLVDLETKGDELVYHDGATWELGFSPDGKRLAAWVSPTPSIDDRYMARRLRVIDVATGDSRAAAENPGKVGNFAWSPDGKTIAFVSGRDINDPKESSIAVVAADGGAMRFLTPADWEGHAAHVHWAGNDELRFIASTGCVTALLQQRVGDGEVSVVLGAGTTQWASWSQSASGDVIAMVGNARMHPNELFVVSKDGPKRVTDSNPWLADVAFAEQEVVSYEARDGLRIEGVLILPLKRDEKKRVPLILQVHGGPEAHYTNGWLTAYSMPGQVAAGRGYAVFHPNYRSSTGRGVAFSKKGQGRSAREEFDDLVDGIDHLAERGLVDVKRVGITGGSYGGYASAWAATYYSDRFAASVMFVGISEQISKVFTTDIPNESFHSHWRMRPWGNWQKYLEASPIYYVERSKTPILIAHGQDDPRVPVAQSIQLYRALRIKGDVPVRLVLYPGEGHGNRNAAARLDYSLRQLRWFDTYLRGDGAEMPPQDVNYEPQPAGF